ncbi:MAG: ParB N-terminal domain-containing protein [Candidatus Magasanikiibacteriota bacterium]
MKIKLLTINSLKPHEHISAKRVVEVVAMIKKAGKFTEPILVEKNTLVILDGHHRVEAMKKLGYEKIPARLVDYKKVEVSLRHKNLSSHIIKEMVLYLASKNIILPQKTTRHLVVR